MEASTGAQNYHRHRGLATQNSSLTIRPSTFLRSVFKFYNNRPIGRVEIVMR